MQDQKAPNDLFQQYNYISIPKLKNNPTDRPYFILAWNRKHITIIFTVTIVYYFHFK